MQFLVEKQESKSLPVPEVAKTRQQVNYDRPDGWGKSYSGQRTRVSLEEAVSESGLEGRWKTLF